MRKLTGALLLLLTLSLPSCIYANVTTPLDTDLNKTTLGSKTGEAHAQSILWMVAWGDAGTKAAATNGGIQTINHADRKFLSVLWGLYTKSTTVVYGE